MKEKLEQRLQSLKAEFEAGKKLMVEYEAKQVSLRETLLRISGAIQVIEEELSQFTEVENDSQSESKEAVVVEN